RLRGTEHRTAPLRKGQRVSDRSGSGQRSPAWPLTKGMSYSVAVTDTRVISIPPIGAACRTGIPIGPAASAVAIIIIIVAIRKGVGHEEWKKEVAMEVAETPVVGIVKVGVLKSHRAEWPARAHPDSCETGVSMHDKAARAEPTCPMREEHRSSAAAGNSAVEAPTADATKPTACFGRGQAKQQSQTECEARECC